MVLVGLTVAVSTGCQIAYPIPRDQIRASMHRYYEATSACAETAPPQRFIHTGHRAGNPDAYARRLNGARPDPLHPAPMAELMDLSFGELGLTAIEFDVRSSPLPGDQSVIIVHDPIKPGSLSETARTYMSANTLRRVLEHFVERGYHRAGHRLLIELKVPSGPEMDTASRMLIDRCAAAVGSLDGHPDVDAIRPAIVFASFNLDALDSMRAMLESIAAADCGYYLMATSNQFPQWIFDWFTPLPRFDRSIEQQLTETPWLTGTVFAPKWVDRFVEIFNRINRDRVEHGLRPLDLHLAIYTESFDDYVRRLGAATSSGDRPLHHVAGLVYEVGGDS